MSKREKKYTWAMAILNLVVFATIVVLSFTGCSTPTETSTEEVVAVQMAQVRNYTARDGCYTWMWCAHCNGGRGGYIKQYFRCPDAPGATSPIRDPGGNSVPVDTVEESQL